MMREYTTIAVPNQYLAASFIIANAERIDTNYRFLVSLIGHSGGGAAPSTYHARIADRRRDRVIAVIATAFMEKYPRGKGTRGSPLKREFYAACYAVQSKRSHARDLQRSRERYMSYRAVALGNLAREALLAFPGNGAAIMDGFPDTRLVTQLTNDGFINGTFHANGKPHYMFLTDTGIVAREALERVVRAQEAKNSEKAEKDRIARMEGALTEIAAMTVGSDAVEALRKAIGIATGALV